MTRITTHPKPTARSTAHPIRRGTAAHAKRPSAWLLTVLPILMLALVVGGCRTQRVSEMPNRSHQLYDLETVKRRLQTLEVGMSTYDVLIRLGSPAAKQPAGWIYLPDRTGLLLPARALRIKFDRLNQYAGHTYEPIILGERLGD